MGCFLTLLKFDEQLLEKQTQLQKKKNQYLNLEVSWNDQRSIFSLNKTGFKIITRQ